MRVVGRGLGRSVGGAGAVQVGDEFGGGVPAVGGLLLEEEGVGGFAGGGAVGCAVDAIGSLEGGGEVGGEIGVGFPGVDFAEICGEPAVGEEVGGVGDACFGVGGALVIQVEAGVGAAVLDVVGLVGRGCGGGVGLVEGDGELDFGGGAGCVDAG